MFYSMTYQANVNQVNVTKLRKKSRQIPDLENSINLARFEMPVQLQTYCA